MIKVGYKSWPTLLINDRHYWQLDSHNHAVLSLCHKQPMLLVLLAVISSHAAKLWNLNTSEMTSKFYWIKYSEFTWSYVVQLGVIYISNTTQHNVLVADKTGNRQQRQVHLVRMKPENTKYASIHAGPCNHITNRNTAKYIALHLENVSLL